MKTPKEIFLKRTYYWSFGLRFALGMLAWILYVTLDLSFFQDAKGYEEIGHGIATDWLSGRASTWLELHGSEPHQPIVMLVGIGCFYTLTLGVRLLPLLLASYAAITSYTPVVMYRLCEEFGASQRACVFTTRLVTFLPIFVFWSGALYKEGLIYLCLSFCLLHTLKLQKHWSPRSLGLVLFNLGMLAGLRTYLAVIVGIVLLFGTLLSNSGQLAARARVSRMISQIGVFCIFTALLIFVGYVTDIRKIFPEDFEQGMNQIQTSRYDLAMANSGYLPDVDISTPWKAIKFMPIGTAYFLCLPKPWDLGSLRQNMAIPDTTIWLVLYPMVFIGMYQGFKRNFAGSFVLIFTTVGVLSLYSVFISNIGTAYRLRAQILLIWSLFAGIGFDFLWARFNHRGNRVNMFQNNNSKLTAVNNSQESTFRNRQQGEIKI